MNNSQINIAVVVGEGDNGYQIVKMVDSIDINCMSSFASVVTNAAKAASLPIDTLVLYSSMLCAEDEDFMTAYTQTRQGVAAILVVDGKITLDTLKRAMACGFNDVVSFNSGADAICNAIRKETAKVKARNTTAAVRQYDSKVIAVYSSKGGSGKTTTASNLATSLHRRGKKVAIVDLDLSSGDVRSVFNVGKAETIAELAGEYDITPATIKSYVTTAPCGVDVLCAPYSPQLSVLITPELVTLIISTLRAEYDYVIVDCDHNIDNGAVTNCCTCAMNEANIVLFVVNPEVPTINGASLVLNKYMSKNPALLGKIRLVVNKDSSESIITANQIEDALGIRMYVLVPYEYKTIVSCLNSGTPYMSIATKNTLFRKNKLLAAYEELTDKIMAEKI